jgi:VIT1/CCC1 family predicted Fe2+/Mn2+ transporter
MPSEAFWGRALWLGLALLFSICAGVTLAVMSRHLVNNEALQVLVGVVLFLICIVLALLFGCIAVYADD